MSSCVGVSLELVAIIVHVIVSAAICSDYQGSLFCCLGSPSPHRPRPVLTFTLTSLSLASSTNLDCRNQRTKEKGQETKDTTRTISTQEELYFCVEPTAVCAGWSTSLLSICTSSQALCPYLVGWFIFFGSRANYNSQLPGHQFGPLCPSLRLRWSASRPSQAAPWSWLCQLP